MSRSKGSTKPSRFAFHTIEISIEQHEIGEFPYDDGTVSEDLAYQIGVYRSFGIDHVPLGQIAGMLSMIRQISTSYVTKTCSQVATLRSSLKKMAIPTKTGSKHMQSIPVAAVPSLIAEVSANARGWTLSQRAKGRKFKEFFEQRAATLTADLGEFSNAGVPSKFACYGTPPDGLYYLGEDVDLSEHYKGAQESFREKPAEQAPTPVDEPVDNGFVDDLPSPPIIPAGVIKVGDYLKIPVARTMIGWLVRTASITDFVRARTMDVEKIAAFGAYSGGRLYRVHFFGAETHWEYGVKVEDLRDLLRALSGSGNTDRIEKFRATVIPMIERAVAEAIPRFDPEPGPEVEPIPSTFVSVPEKTFVANVAPGSEVDIPREFIDKLSEADGQTWVVNLVDDSPADILPTPEEPKGDSPVVTDIFGQTWAVDFVDAPATTSEESGLHLIDDDVPEENVESISSAALYDDSGNAIDKNGDAPASMTADDDPILPKSVRETQGAVRELRRAFGSGTNSTADSTDDTSSTQTVAKGPFLDEISSLGLSAAVSYADRCFELYRLLDEFEFSSTPSKKMKLLEMAYGALTRENLFSGLTAARYLEESRNVIPTKLPVAAAFFGRNLKIHFRKQFIAEGIVNEMKPTLSPNGRPVVENVYPDKLRPHFDLVFERLVKSSDKFRSYLREDVVETIMSKD